MSDDIEVIDKHAERQAGYDRTLRRDAQPARTRAPARKRTRTPAPTGDMPQAAGKYYVRLVRGRTYVLAGTPDLVFEHGVTVEVTKEVHAYLANAIDELPMFKDRELGRVCRRARKFQASPEYPAIPDRLPDCD